MKMNSKITMAKSLSKPLTLPLALSLGGLILASCQPVATPLSGHQKAQVIEVGVQPSANPLGLHSAPELLAHGGIISTPEGKRLQISLASLQQDFRTQALDCGKISSLSISIDGIGMTTIISSAFPTIVGSCNFTSSPIPAIPVGKARIITVKASDSLGNELANIKSAADIVDGVTTSFEISYKTHVTARILEELIDSFKIAGDFGILSENPMPTPSPTARPPGSNNSPLGQIYAANLSLTALQAWVDSLTGASGTFPNYTYTRHPMFLKPHVLAGAIFNNGGQIPANPPAGYLLNPATLVVNFSNTYTGSPLVVKYRDPLAGPQTVAAPTSSQTVTFTNVIPGTWKLDYTNSQSGSQNVTLTEGQSMNLDIDVGAPVAPSSNWNRLNGGPEAGKVIKLVKDSSGQAYAATPGGVYYLSGATWVEANQGLPAGFKLTAIASNPSLPGERYVFVAAANNHVYSRDFATAGTTWQDMGEAIPVSATNFITMLYVEPTSNSVVQAGSNEGQLVRTSNALFASPIWGGISFNPIGVPIKGMTKSSGNYYLATHDGLYRGNAPNPTGWTRFASGLGSDTNLDTVFVNASGSTVMVGSDTGSFYTASTGAMNFSANNNGLSGAGIRDILQDGDLNHTIYLATGSALKKASDSDDDGVPDLAGFGPAGNISGSPYPPDAPMSPFLTSLLLTTGTSIMTGSEGAGVTTYDTSDNTWTNANAGLKAGQIRGILSAPYSGGFFVGIDGGGVARSLDSGDSFTSMLKVSENGKERSVTSLAAQPGLSIGNFDLFMATRGTGVWVLNGLSFSSSPESVWSKVGTLPDLNVNALYLINNTKLLAATPTGVYYTTCPAGSSCAAASSWTQYSGLNAPTAAYSLAKMPGGTTLYVGGTQAVHVTSNGTTWTKPTVGTNAAQKVISLATLPNPGSAPDNDVVYAGLTRSGMLPNFYRSIDAGLTWLALGNPADDVDVNSLLVDASDVNKIYAGTSSGVYISTNGGSSWAPLTTGGTENLANIEILTMAIFNNKLYVGTRDRSVYSIDLGTSGCSPAC